MDIHSKELFEFMKGVFGLSLDRDTVAGRVLLQRKFVHVSDVSVDLRS